jgi:Domain of unknown function (DUF4440)
MTRWFAISTLLLALTVGCWKEPSKFNWKSAPGAEQHERLMWQAIREKSWDEVEHHLAPSFVGVSANGQKFDRAGWVEYCKGLQIADLSLGELTVEPNGPDMVVTYDLQLSTTTPGNAFRVISVWQQLKGGWVLISQSATPIK